MAERGQLAPRRRSRRDHRGCSIDPRNRWCNQVVGDNLTNAKGLTEGNPRTDQLAGQGATDAIYGRPLFGRNFRLILSRSW